MTDGSTLIVGIGSPFGDDAVGWEIADALLKEDVRPKIKIKKAASPIHLLDWLENVERLILCDACHDGDVIGLARRNVWPDPQLMQLTWTGTHDFSLIATIRLAEKLKRLPPNVVFWTVTANAAMSVDAMSPEVVATVPKIARSIMNELTSASNLKDEACTNSRS
jgi:hydrogenase maturation protease